MEKICESCGKSKEESSNGLYSYYCRICRGVYTFCDTCSTVVYREQKCIECLNDGK